ncbi:hypothetical protein O7606_00095 [Micromonospora sp. WMMD882]|uniref:hypothetical protein n=1 Tax=Micromonospora sp. WMMD882 TaxID=3015151 RepID=UPI00248ABCFB|nr:hypothetical protein [Micromonospora sp. WMMD882]WBB79853.1 hypothetical protein O7606_00095 [Micromonospora sp. WMMD882]
MESRLGFVVSEGQIRNDIFVPKYYDPEIEATIESYSETHYLVPVSELMASGELEMRQGNYIPKMHYGTGSVPYIRTSDIANWELRGSPKHGISDNVAQVFRQKQNVRSDDVLLVHEGTYLIGTGCLITQFDTDILYQHHLARLRVINDTRINGPLLMCALISSVVQSQIRSKQFTADVIDSIVGRFPEVRIPIPKSQQRRAELTTRARSLFRDRAEARLRLAVFRRGLDAALESGDLNGLRKEVEEAPETANNHGIVGFLGSSYKAESFTITDGQVRNNILLPRYYDPAAEDALSNLSGECELVSMGDLVESGVVELSTGDEVGKLAYGTGKIPFVRTSDLGNWELKQDPKQRVSLEVYEKFARKQSARSEDILLVRDGTYLVGSSAMVTGYDLPLLFSGGLYRIRVTRPEALDPYLLLALLNTQVAGRQMRNKQFTRDVIDTLGRRFEEVRLPIPRSVEVRAGIASLMRDLVEKRADLRYAVGQLGNELLGKKIPRQRSS